MGGSWAATSVCLLAQGSDHPTEVVAFGDDVRWMHVEIRWLTPTHLEVAYGPRVAGDSVPIYFQAVRLANVDISLRRDSAVAHK
jgi:hypothetical protein